MLSLSGYGTGVFILLTENSLLFYTAEKAYPIDGDYEYQEIKKCYGGILALNRLSKIVSFVSYKTFRIIWNITVEDA